ncbi:hypothetical protein LEMLEM_LOCUS20886, partial [Lemmus lemmus]
DLKCVLNLLLLPPKCWDYRWRPQCLPSGLHTLGCLHRRMDLLHLHPLTYILQPQKLQKALLLGYLGCRMAAPVLR